MNFGDPRNDIATSMMHQRMGAGGGGFGGGFAGGAGMFGGGSGSFSPAFNSPRSSMGTGAMPAPANAMPAPAPPPPVLGGDPPQQPGAAGMGGIVTQTPQGGADFGRDVSIPALGQPQPTPGMTGWNPMAADTGGGDWRGGTGAISGMGQPPMQIPYSPPAGQTGPPPPAWAPFSGLPPDWNAMGVPAPARYGMPGSMGAQQSAPYDPANPAKWNPITGVSGGV